MCVIERGEHDAMHVHVVERVHRVSGIPVADIFVSLRCSNVSTAAMSFFKQLLRVKTLNAILAEADERHSLKRVLGATDLVMLGIGAIVGAGIFATVGTAAAGDTLRPGAGPSLILSFVITGIACGFAALCYSEFATLVPISGSAYTYAYATLGELVAWVIGWDLIIEYAVGNVAVAISWSGYFVELLRGFGIELPAWSTIDYRSAMQGFHRAVEAMQHGTAFQQLDPALAHAWGAVQHAPTMFGLHIIFNIPASAIVLAITAVLVVGIKESARFNEIMVAIKLVVLAFFVIIGSFYVKPQNWTPFAPNGFAGIKAGAAIVFFAYIGFDAVSTVAEETRRPSRDIPIGIIASLVICTLIYIAVAAVFTGIIPFPMLQSSLAHEKAEPLTMALKYLNLNWAAGIVAFGSVVAHTAVLLVFQLGQPRIFFSMARDGLLPQSFARVHPRFKTPHVTTIVTGLLVALFAAFMNIDEMVDLTNIGTLFAFALVCLGVVILRVREPERHRAFRVPWSPFVPVLGILCCVFLMTGLPSVTWERFFIWLAAGSLIYFLYGMKRSRLHRSVSESGNAASPPPTKPDAK
jgi:basic amino acid/polyamine antiporter, APA family